MPSHAHRPTIAPQPNCCSGALRAPVGGHRPPLQRPAIARVIRGAIVLALLYLLFLLPCIGQQSGTPLQQVPRRDPQAWATVQNALAAMGGLSNISTIQNVVVQGTSHVTPTDDSGEYCNFTWISAGRDFRYENNATSGGHILVSNGGNPRDLRDGTWSAVTPILARVELPYHIPALALLIEAGNPAYSFIYVGVGALNGRAAIHIQSRDDSDQIETLYSPQDWYFDAKTGLPMRVEYQSPLMPNRDGLSSASIDFGNFSSISGILVPFQLNMTYGPVSLTAAVSSVAFNSAVDPSTFLASDGGTQ